MSKKLKGILNLFALGFVSAVGITLLGALMMFGTSMYYKWYVEFNVQNSEYAYTNLIDSKGTEYKAELASLVDNKDYSGKTITFYDANSEKQVTLNPDDLLVIGHIDKDGNLHNKEAVKLIKD